jgi:hypothetical protein
MGLPAHQLVSPSFARADELDTAGQAEGFELAFDGLEAAAEVIRNACGTQLVGLENILRESKTLLSTSA